MSAPDEVDAGLELVHAELLHAGIVDADLRVGHTAAVARLDVRLVLLVAVAAGRACGDRKNINITTQDVLLCI